MTIIKHKHKGSTSEGFLDTQLLRRLIETGGTNILTSDVSVLVDHIDSLERELIISNSECSRLKAAFELGVAVEAVNKNDFIEYIDTGKKPNPQVISNVLSELERADSIRRRAVREERDRCLEIVRNPHVNDSMRSMSDMLDSIVDAISSGPNVE